VEGAHKEKEATQMKQVSAFLDDQGNSRVLINGRVQPVRYTHQNHIHNEPQDIDITRLGEHIDMRLEHNRMAYPHLCGDNRQARKELWGGWDFALANFKPTQKG
jgi:hypothetical protein